MLIKNCFVLSFFLLYSPLLITIVYINFIIKKWIIICWCINQLRILKRVTIHIEVFVFVDNHTHTVIRSNSVIVDSIECKMFKFMIFLKCNLWMFAITSITNNAVTMLSIFTVTSFTQVWTWAVIHTRTENIDVWHIITHNVIVCIFFLCWINFVIVHDSHEVIQSKIAIEIIDVSLFLRVTCFYKDFQNFHMVSVNNDNLITATVRSLSRLTISSIIYC